MPSALPVRIIAPCGAIDLAAERRLRYELSEAAGDTSRQLVLDLRGITSMDSSTLAVLAHAHQRFQRQSRAIALIVRPGIVERLLDATGLRDELAVFEDRGEALQHVQGRSPEVLAA